MRNEARGQSVVIAKLRDLLCLSRYKRFFGSSPRALTTPEPTPNPLVTGTSQVLTAALAAHLQPQAVNVSESLEVAPPYRRFLSDTSVPYQPTISAAESYVSNLRGGELTWLHCKPFDPTPGNSQYFRLMFDLLNMLQAMQVRPQGRILEVGSGPGWVTEILLMLGFSVDALEPSRDLIDIARERCTALATHHRHCAISRLTFHQTTLEEVEFEDESFDAILFFDVLHHVVHENEALEKCYRFMKPDARLGIVEGAWHPNFKELEKNCIDEMEKFGTLENPFSTEYLDLLLKKHGFIDVQRHVAVNGFFSNNQLAQPLRNFAVQNIGHSNNVTARRPSDDECRYPACTVLERQTNVHLHLLSGGIDAENKTVAIHLRVKNTGETLLSHRAQQIGHVTIALRQGDPEASVFFECRERHVIPESLRPGDEIILNLAYTLPLTASSLENWQVDLVAEHCFWFSSRGIQSCSIPIFVKGL